MNKEDIEKIYNLYSNVWKERCSKFPNESSIGIIKEAPARIVVLGDLHGDWNATIKSLVKAKLIDANNYNKWIGGDTVLVQLGDQIDRCRLDRGFCHLEGATINDEASDMKILRYFTFLHNEAIKIGGAVYSILGNHEVMNVDGDFRYVSRKNLLEFSKDGTWEDGVKKRREKFKPGNEIANFLACTRKTALVIGKNLFIHAGIVPEIANKYNVNDINRIIALYLFDKLNDKNKYSDLLTNSKTSPYWTRLLGNLNKRDDTEKVKEICDSIFDSGVLTNLLGTDSNHKIERIFLGHTPQIMEGINTMCDDRIYYVDVGVSQAFDSYDKILQNKNERSKSRNYPFIEIINDTTVNYDKN
tara:strand:- start:574 stop:1647 length:1074 start_codon:yes stop_codon:yes gene_type:complete